MVREGARLGIHHAYTSAFRHWPANRNAHFSRMQEVRHNEVRQDQDAQFAPDSAADMPHQPGPTRDRQQGALGQGLAHDLRAPRRALARPRGAGGGVRGDGLGGGAG